MSDAYGHYEPDLDDLPRARLGETDLGKMPADLAGVLDDWLHRNHGVLSSSHNVGDFLEGLAAAGYRVTAIQRPDAVLVKTIDGGEFWVPAAAVE